MGFWGSLGKGALKVGKIAAPIALAATGVGIPAAMAVNAGLNALDKKVSGGSWKDAALSGAIGGATGAIPGMGGVGGKVTGGLTSTLANVGKGLLKDPNTYASIAGGLAGGMEKGRQAENVGKLQTADFKAQQAAQREAALMNRAGLDLKQRDFAQGSQNNAYKNALLSSMAMNMKDVSANRPKGIPTIAFSGGMRPSAIGPEGRAAAATMNKKSLASLVGGEQFDKMPAYAGVDAPEYKNPGFWENALGVTGMVGKQVAGQQDAARQNEFQNKILAQIEKLNQPQVTPQQPVSGTQFQPMVHKPKNPWEVSF